jgi:hypothetical protein
MDDWNESIWWSYAPIPLLVAVCLRVEHKWSRAALLLETMKLTFVKFVVTFVAANALWAVWGTPGTGVPPAARVTEAGSSAFEPSVAPPATELDPALQGDLVGIVRDSQGTPVRDALVWVAAGLERYVFAAPVEELVLENRGRGFLPRLAVAQTFRPLVLRADGPELHTLVISDRRRRALFNYPVLSQRERTIMFSREYGLLELACTVHGAAEEHSQLLVSANPFHGWTDARGRFDLRGVPQGEVVLGALSPSLGEQRLSTEVLAGREQAVQVLLRGTAIR